MRRLALGFCTSALLGLPLCGQVMQEAILHGGNSAQVPAWIQSCTNEPDSGSSITSISCTFGSAIGAGHFLHMCVGVYPGPVTVTWSGDSATFTNYVANYLSAQTLTCAWAAPTGGGATTITATFASSSYVNIWGDEFSGVATSSALDTSSFMATGTSSTATSNSITPAANRELLIAVVVIPIYTSVTPGGSFATGDGTSGMLIGVTSYYVQSTAASISASFTFGTSTQWSVGIAAFKHG